MQETGEKNLSHANESQLEGTKPPDNLQDSEQDNKIDIPSDHEIDRQGEHADIVSSSEANNAGKESGEGTQDAGSQDAGTEEKKQAQLPEESSKAKDFAAFS